MNAMGSIRGSSDELPRDSDNSPSAEGWGLWREIRSNRPGVAGAHLALEDLARMAYDLIDELEEQLEIEKDHPNEGRYEMGEQTLQDRNQKHNVTIDYAEDCIHDAIKNLRRAAEIVVTRWST
jgi:hypothetical protein